MQGARRLLTDGRHAPCIFPCPPCIPPRGNSRPPAPQNKVCRRRARAFLCSSPVTPPAFALAALRQGRRHPFPLPHGPAPPLLFLARFFLSTNIPGLPPQKGQGPRQPLTGLSGPLLRCANAAAVLRAVMPPAHRAQAAPPGGVAARAFSAGVLPAFQPVTSFAFSFCFRVRLATGSLAWAMPHDRLGWRRVPGQGICEDGGGVAVAGVAPKRRSLPAL